MWQDIDADAPADTIPGYSFLDYVDGTLVCPRSSCLQPGLCEIEGVTWEEIKTGVKNPSFLICSPTTTADAPPNPPAMNDFAESVAEDAFAVSLAYTKAANLHTSASELPEYHSPCRSQ